MWPTFKEREQIMLFFKQKCLIQYWKLKNYMYIKIHDCSRSSFFPCEAKTAPDMVQSIWPIDLRPARSTYLQKKFFRVVHSKFWIRSYPVNQIIEDPKKKKLCTIKDMDKMFVKLYTILQILVITFTNASNMLSQKEKGKKTLCSNLRVKSLESWSR